MRGAGIPSEIWAEIDIRSAVSLCCHVSGVLRGAVSTALSDLLAELRQTRYGQFGVRIRHFGEVFATVELPFSAASWDS